MIDGDADPLPATSSSGLAADPLPRSADHELDRVIGWLSSKPRLDLVRQAVRQALDEVIATARTRRWNLDQCNNQEKAYVGVNLENILRACLDLPPHRPRRPDFDIAGVEVDCKWSRQLNGWMIPQEALGHLCLLVYGDDLDDRMAVGLIRIRDEILVKGNRDGKRNLQSPEGLSEVRWLLEPGPWLPPNFLMSLRKVDRDAILGQSSGDARLQMLFRRCEGMTISRDVIEAVGQQKDAARRARGSTIECLLDEGLEVLNGWKVEKQQRAKELGGPKIDASTWVCLRSDGTTPSRNVQTDAVRRTEAALYRRQLKAELAAQRRKARALRLEEQELLRSVEQEQEQESLEAADAVEHAAATASLTTEQLRLDAV